MAKRARERSRQERKDAKRAQRLAASAAPKSTDAPQEDALMEEFRVLSEGHAAGRISEEAYRQERHRIFVELGIETDDDV